MARAWTRWNEYFRKILILTFHPRRTSCTLEPGYFKCQAWNPISHLNLFFLMSGKLVHLFFLEYFILQCVSKELHQSRLTWKQSLCRFNWMSESRQNQVLWNWEWSMVKGERKIGEVEAVIAFRLSAFLLVDMKFCPKKIW